MNLGESNITADAVALQERDAFCAQGWLKVVAPAKVNLHLHVGARRDDGYHDVSTIMHGLNLHDVVYLRRIPDTVPGGLPVEVRMVAAGGFDVPEIPVEDNLAVRAVMALADRAAGAGPAGTGFGALELRIEKAIPSQAGLGGGSADAAAALVGAAALWGLAPTDPAIEAAARELGSDVAFFLHGGCACFDGVGERFVRALEPMRRPVVLVKPEAGVSTPAAYRAFDGLPSVPDAPQGPRHADRAPADRVPADRAPAGRAPATCALEAGFDPVARAEEVVLFNNLAPAAEALLPELADIRAWLVSQPGVEGALLCGSGSATFAVCDSFASACRVVGEARKRGLWSRATSFGSLRAVPVAADGA